MSENLKDYRIKFLLENYKSLREEILESIRLQSRIIMSEGIAVAVGIIIGFGLTESMFSAIIIAVPLIIIALSSLWAIEQSRMMRAGDFMQFLEDKINLEVGEPCTFWENWLRRKGVKPLDVHKVHHLTQYLCTLGVFYVIGIAVIISLALYPTFFNVPLPIVRFFTIFYSIMFTFLLLILKVIITHRGAESDKDGFREWLDKYWNKETNRVKTEGKDHESINR